MGPSVSAGIAVAKIKSKPIKKEKIYII